MYIQALFKPVRTLGCSKEPEPSLADDSHVTSSGISFLDSQDRFRLLCPNIKGNGGICFLSISA